MSNRSLFEQGHYSLDWVMGFFDQLTEWWGPEREADVCQSRLDAIRRWCGPHPLTILDLGSGSGSCAAMLANAGHHVVAVDSSPSRSQDTRERKGLVRRGSLTVVQADFYEVELDETYDVVCMWELFGLGGDGDQWRILRRIAEEWLAPQGHAIIDVFSPAKPARLAGQERRYGPFPGIDELIRHCHYDPVHSRWIDEWTPAGAPEKALARAIRCYSPADLLLLLEGTGLTVRDIEVDGQPIDWQSGHITDGGPLLDTWLYRVHLTRTGEPPLTGRHP